MPSVRKPTENAPRLEEFTVTNQDNITYHVVRNLDTGEQTVTRIDADIPTFGSV